MTTWSVSEIMLALSLFWLGLGLWRWLSRPSARLQAQIWLLVGLIFLAAGLWQR